MFLLLQELIYVWNGFSIIGKRTEFLDPVIQNVEAALNDIVTQKGESICIPNNGLACMLSVWFRWTSGVQNDTSLYPLLSK